MRVPFRRSLILPAAFLLLLLAAPAASAAKTPAVTLQMDGRTETVKLIRSTNLWTLMLPSSADPAGMAGTGGLVLPGLTGLAQSEDSRIGVTIGGKASKLRILPSRNTGTVFVDLDRLSLSQFGSSKRR